MCLLNFQLESFYLLVVRVPVLKFKTNKFKFNFYLLVVRVPVLSEQMVVALPIVSQASRCLTRLLSLIIFCNKLFCVRSMLYAEQFEFVHELRILRKLRGVDFDIKYAI